MYGVSPAWFIARFGDRFSVDQMIGDFEDIRKLGFDHVQLELFHEDKFTEWTEEKIDLVNNKLKENSLKTEQFVAHYMLNGFFTPRKVDSNLGEETYKKLLKTIKKIEGTKRVCVPLPPFVCAETMSKIQIESVRKLAYKKLKRICDMANDEGFEFCVEIMPYAFIGGLNGFMEAQNTIKDLKLCLDTKHAFFSRENFDYVMPRLADLIVSTHLCDNAGLENVSNRPGNGGINWEDLLLTLERTGYDGSYDLEIVANPDKILYEYRMGKDFIESIHKNITV